MKFILFLALVSVASGESPIRGDSSSLTDQQTERKLLDGNLSFLAAYYDPKGDIKCRFSYGIKGSPGEIATVHFKDSQIEVDNSFGKVTCSKTLKPSFGVDLPVKENKGGSDGLPLSSAEWTNEVVRDFDALWEKNNKLKVEIKIFRDWEALYDNEECHLTYKFGGDPVVISFRPSEIKVQGNKVVCMRKNVGDELLPEEKGLREIKKDISIKDAKWRGNKVIDADVSWEYDEPLVLVIKREPPPKPPTKRPTPAPKPPTKRPTARPPTKAPKEKTTEEDFKKLELEYDDLEGVVNFEFTSDDGISGDLEFSGEEVEEDGLVVTFNGCRSPPDGLSLPIEIDFNVKKEVTWGTRCNTKEDFKPVVSVRSFLTWKYDGSCDSRDRHERALKRKRARVDGRIKRKGK